MKFSIITPTYNSEKYLTETIESVLSQKGDFEIEYIIIDGGSTDKTIEIIKKYSEKYPIKWISEKDNGMYSAINKGFSIATGDIFAWINSDDIYLPNAFQTISKTIKKYPEIDWLKGTTLISNEKLNTIKKSPCYIYNQKWIEKGIYGRNAYFIHQDSVFWTKELWNKVSKIDDKLKLAGDYDLWIKFAKLSSLWSINKPISRFRKRMNQLSKNMKDYRKEQKEISSEQKDLLTFKIKLFFWLKTKLPTIFEPIFIFKYKLLFWDRNKYYINIENNEPIKRKVNSYIAK
ncbi:MAG: glycosyltransferase [Candidatus Pacebacteria bacterium]|nr:glycosyltransferase [Candidatus Paceibacterota bacterium]